MYFNIIKFWELGLILIEQNSKKFINIIQNKFPKISKREVFLTLELELIKM